MSDLEQYYEGELMQLRERIEELQAECDRARRAEETMHESNNDLRDRLSRYARALWRWRHRAWNAERAVKRALPLIEPIANVYDRIEQMSYGGPPSPLLAVRGEASRAQEAYKILKEIQDERDKARRHN
jgi:hypothetical protein